MVDVGGVGWGGGEGIKNRFLLCPGCGDVCKIT